MHIEVLWSPNVGQRAVLSGSSSVAQALVYADSIGIIAPETDSLFESTDWRDIVGTFGGAVSMEGTDSLLFGTMRDAEKAADFLAALLVDAASLLAAGDQINAFRRLRLTHVALRILAPDTPGPDYPVDLDDLVSYTTSGFQMDLTPIARFINLNSAKICRRPFDGTTREQGQVERALAVYEFLGRSSAAENYPLIDDARGVWTSATAQSRLLSGAKRDRAATASLAVGQIAHLPSAKMLDWHTVKTVREELKLPLTRFRAAMGRLASNAEAHPLDGDFEGFIETVWVTEVAPALAEISDLSREASLRSVFFDDVMGDLKTYAGPVFALMADRLSNMPAALSAGVAIGAPVVNSIKNMRARKRLLASKDFLFLASLEKEILARR